MKERSKLWRLFSGDLEGWLVEEASKEDIDAQTLHWILNTGYHNIVEAKVDKLEKKELNMGEKSALRYRLNRIRKLTNPYAGVIELPDSNQKQIKDILRDYYIVLTGGIGDQIEQIAKIKDCSIDKGQN